MAAMHFDSKFLIPSSQPAVKRLYIGRAFELLARLLCVLPGWDGTHVLHPVCTDSWSLLVVVIVVVVAL